MGLRHVYDPAWAIENAYTVLAQDPTGLEAQQEIRLHLTILLYAYECVAYLAQLQGEGHTLPEAVQGALAEVGRLTQQSYREEPHATA